VRDRLRKCALARFDLRHIRGVVASRIGLHDLGASGSRADILQSTLPAADEPIDQEFVAGRPIGLNEVASGAVLIPRLVDRLRIVSSAQVAGDVFEIGNADRRCVRLPIQFGGGHWLSLYEAQHSWLTRLVA
jgi:hypothetical protein